ncbi:DUF1007 family protein [Rhodoplanes sp. TEM]|uniref:DUF1007 family protein n=1 Tax=Rhodoplanes tepidamans TaxID=200616 RepID=A0ABT5J9F9_RHOTP|nr:MULTISPECIES: DUF1007 family protein [Rhodoplanes]MDC7786295.1 DUF1007 family protein [Rhodoplanes tepidamans]MDC7982334.1 DUF1007 family protein [Rhodoplanes sp. TEM]MDQ0355094.1 ABC-type uncharacterized transport system substrate-binding protein [Rhodoplanes tepidamans]
MTNRSTARLRGLAVLLALAACLLLPRGALAHPHVWVVMKSELVYGPDGSVTGVRHAWTFDDMFSTYATQGLESKQKGVFTREELKDLAEVNVTSLKEYDFFTYAKLDGRTSPFKDPTDYWLEFKDSMLTLHFTLPLKTPAKAKGIDLEVYDPSYFVDFSFADGADPVALKNPPGACKVAVSKPTDGDATAKLQSLGEAAFGQDNARFGQLFANKVSVRCP